MNPTLKRIEEIEGEVCYFDGRPSRAYSDKQWLCARLRDAFLLLDATPPGSREDRSAAYRRLFGEEK